MITDQFDVAIVGGGVSGIYAGWRLLESALEGSVFADRVNGNGKPLTVGVFEVSQRLGGRLMSVQLPGQEDTPAELGGMRFLESHQRVFQLVKHLGLEYKDLPVADPNNSTLAYLRGKHFRASDLGNLDFEPPYRLDRTERGRTPGSLLIEVALRHVQEAEKLRDVGFWNLLLDEMSLESYQFLREAGGYDTLVHNWSAAEAIPFLLADFAPDAIYLALKAGFQSLPLQLAKRFVKAGGTIHSQHRLHRLDERTDGEFTLTFDTGAPSANYRYRQVAQEKICRARHVILAMPRRAIELLHPESVPFKIAGFESNLESVLPQPAFKIFAAYRRPWWKEMRDVEAGRSVTDLPIRQCYYWNTVEKTIKSEKTGKEEVIGMPSCLMASYSDGASVEFWSGLARQAPRYSPSPGVCPPGVPIPDNLQNLSASTALVEQLHAQLRELHALPELPASSPESVPRPYCVVSQNWMQEPFGGGWHFWKIGVNAAAIERRMRQPDPDKALYICGEAWSRQQGWVEGALETTEDLLQKELRVPAPDWLNLK